MRKKYLAGLVMMALALGVTACSSSGEADGTQETTEDAATTAQELLESYEPVIYENLTSTVVTLGQYRGIEMDASAAVASARVKFL